MRKIITLVLLVSFFGASAQYQTVNTPGYRWKGGIFDTSLHIPTFCGVPTLLDAYYYKSAVGFDSCGHQFYIYDPSLRSWNLISGSISAPKINNRYYTGYGTWGTLITDSLLIGTRQFYHDTLTRKAISLTNNPAAGATYNTTTGAFNIPYAWNMVGNSVVDSNVLGTTNNKHLKFITNNIERFRIDSAGRAIVQAPVIGTPTNFFSIQNADTNQVLNVAAGNTIATISLKPNNIAFTPTGASSGFGPLEIGGTYRDYFKSKGIYKGMDFETYDGFQFTIPSGTPGYILNVRKGTVPQVYIKSDGSALFGDTTGMKGVGLGITIDSARAFLLPRMSSARKFKIPQKITGMMVWDTDSVGVSVKVPGGDSAWQDLELGTASSNSNTGDIQEVISGVFMLGGGTSGSVTVNFDTATAKGYFVRRKEDSAIVFISPAQHATKINTIYKKSATDSIFRVKGTDTAWVYNDMRGADSLRRQKAGDTVWQYIAGVKSFAFTDSLGVRGVDSIRRKTAGDTVWQYIAGVRSFAFKDSLGVRGIDSIRRKTAGDTVWQYTAGVRSFAFKDSLGVRGVDSVRRDKATINVYTYTNGVKSFAYTDSIGSGGPGGGSVDSIKNINDSTQRVWYHNGTTKDLKFVTDSIHLYGEIVGRGTDSVLANLADTVKGLHVFTASNIFEANTRMYGGFQTNNSSTNSNIYTQTGTGIMTNITAPQYVPLPGPTINGMGMRIGISGQSTGTLGASYGYANVNIGESPVTLSTSGGKHPFLTQILLNDYGTITNADGVRSNVVSALYIPRLAARNFADTLVGIYNASKTVLLDSVRIPTVSTGDSSNLAATTAWVKRQSFGTGGGGGGIKTVGTFSTTTNDDGLSISGTTITAHPASDTTPGMMSTGSQIFTGTKSFSGLLTASGTFRTSTSTTGANFMVLGSSSAQGVSNTWYQLGGAGINYMRVGIYGANSTVISAGASYSTAMIGASPVTAAASGTTPEINQLSIKAPVITMQGGSILPSTALLRLDSVPTQGTNNYSILSLSGLAWLKGGVKAPNFIGVATRADTLNNARSIYGNSFNGTADITARLTNTYLPVTTVYNNQSNTFATSTTQTFLSDIVVSKMAVGNKGDSSNSYFGYSSGAAMGASGHQNSFYGGWAGRNTTSGVGNSAFGYNALFSNNVGLGNSSLGAYALYSNTTGNFNTAVGENAIVNNISGGANTAIGESSLLTLTTGSNNTAIGYRALNFTKTTSNNVALGYLAGYNNTGTNNTLIGQNAMLAYNANNASNYDNTIYIINKNGHDSVPGGASIGVNITSPTSTLQVNGSVGYSYRAVSAGTTILATDYTVDCTSGTFTVALPTAVGIAGRTYVVKNSGSGSITVGTTSSQNIDASTTYVLGSINKYVTVQSTGVKWIVIGNN